MLIQLSITNFAIIERLDLAPSLGLNVLTGETGAGKSIIIDAIGALLGGRVGAEYIRSGASQARIEGIFEPPDVPRLRELLAEQGVSTEDGTLILSREINASGRSIARVGGRAVPTAVLQEIGQALIDVHGQTDNLSLLRPAEHVDFLDGFAGTQAPRGQLAGLAAEIRATQRMIAGLLRDERELARRADLLRFQVEEIDAARLRPDEEEELLQERNLLANAERLAAAADAAYVALYGGDSPGALDLLGEASAQVEDLADIDPTLEPKQRTLLDATDQITDLARELRAYRDAIEFDPERLAAVEERLELIRNLKRKYGSTIAEVIAFGQTAARELDEMTHSEERVAELRAVEERLRAQAGQVAAELSAARQDAARELERRVEAELADLNMVRARFAVQIERLPDPDGLPLPDGERYAFDATGVDRVEFLIAPNPGEPLKPLAKIASGGETSRLMLALKTILARADRVPVLIFDEVDAGIGGRTGRIVGQKLAALAQERQVLCVTHLPQIACFADVHYRIAKRLVGERTLTEVAVLAEEQRLDELAAMLGGIEQSARAKENARELLQTAAVWKQERRGASREGEAGTTGYPGVQTSLIPAQEQPA